MGSYISIGIVSNDQKDVFLKKCVKVLDKNSRNIIRLVIKYPNDIDCNNWIEKVEKVENIKKLFEICYKSELAEIIMDYKMDENLIKNIIIKVKRSLKSYTGILFEIPEENFDLKYILNDLEVSIISELKEILDIGFEYAYCDNETDIEYSIEEILEKEKIYSILLIKNKRNILLKLGSWRIDGITNRCEM